MAPRGSSTSSLLTWAAGALLIGGIVGLLRAGRPQVETLQACDGVTDAFCSEVVDSASARAASGDAATSARSAARTAAAPTLAASEACLDVGYLCAPLETAPTLRLQRWKDFTGTIVIHVPRPDFEAPADALALQQAATVGLRAWNGQPFQIATDTRGEQEANFEVRWARTLGGNQIGLTRTQWSRANGLRVTSIELSTRSPFDPDRMIDARQVRLTAAHEMGHALGLPHSNASRDVMYPTNTATSLSAQDYRTMESLYRLPDGTEIVR